MITEEGKTTKHRTTGDVLDRLRRLGLFVTSTMIADDTAAHYLPDRQTAHRGRDGASGVWEPWMVRRAERLYRLRALDRRTRRGPSGNVLRLFLFLSDGWGWGYIRQTCIEGYRINLRGSTIGVANRVRGRKLTLADLLEFADDIAADQYRSEWPNQAQIDRVKMTIGLLKFGVAPDGKMGTIERIMDDLAPPDFDPQEVRKFKPFAPILWTIIFPAERDALGILESDLDDRIIQRSLRHFRHLVWSVRSAFHRRFTQRENGKRFTTNPLTFFGLAGRFRATEVFRRMPIRCTPAQMLGAHVAHVVLLTFGAEQMDKLAGFFHTWLAWWLQSEQSAQWIAQMEREANRSNN